MTPELKVKWRTNTYQLPTTPTLTLATLKTSLHQLTSVPPTRQRLIFPPPHRPNSEHIPLFPDGNVPRQPVMLLGTPVTEEQPSSNQQSQISQVVDDLDELTKTPPPVSPPSDPPHSRQTFIDLSPPSSPEITPPREDPSATNGASLGLETLSDFLTPATTATAFRSQYGTPAWFASESESLLEAIQASKRSLRMLAVLLFNFAQRPEQSTALLSASMTNEMLAPTLDSLAVYPADLSTLSDNGAQLLQRLGLHDVPALLVLGDVGAGIGVVDMCHVGWFGEMAENGGTELAMRIQETIARFEEVYEMARARRVASEERGDMIAEQDEALEMSRLQDLQREREQQMEQERLEREEEERRNEEERQKEEARVARKALPEEPEKGTRVAVRLPGGTRVQRRFKEDDRVRDLFNFCKAEGVVGSFSLVCSFPRKTVTRNEDDCTLQSVGFVPSVLLDVETE